MSENTTTEVPTEEKTFGMDVRNVLKEYEDTCNYAQRVHDDAFNTFTSVFTETVAGVNKLFGAGTVEANGVTDLIRALSAEKRAEQNRVANEVRDRIIEMAKKKRDEVLDAEPFTKFVVTHIEDEYGPGYAETLLRHMPFTFASLIELATSEGWCDDYERAMKEAVDRGALPDDKVEVRRSVDWYDAPLDYNAKDNEVWERVFEVPAFVRTVDSGGYARSTYSLARWLSADRFERISPAPEAASEDKPVSED
jgi:hypothetical protein